MAGLTVSGFQKKTLIEVKAEIEASLKIGFGEFINLLPEGVFGQLVGIFSEREALMWDLAEEVYNSQYPDTAEGAALDNVVSLTGTERIAARKSRITKQLLFGTLGSTIPAGTIIAVDGNPDGRFLTDAEVILIAGVDEVQKIAFGAVPDAGSWKISFDGEETGTLAFNISAANLQIAINALAKLSGMVVTGNFTAGFTFSFEGDDGKQDQPMLVVSLNTLTASAVPVVTTVTEETAGVPQGQTTMTAEVTGPIPAPKNTLTDIVTPVTGLTRTLNTDDAEVGRNVETDAELRLRRTLELQKAGAATVEAIRAKLLTVEGVSQAIVFENDDVIVSPEGLPPKSFQAFVQGGDNADIIDALWDSKAAGIRTHGAITGVKVDSMGINHTLRFSRPVELNIFIKIEVTKDFSAAANVATLVRNALAEYIGALQIGQDIVVYPSLVSVLNEIQGIVDLRIGINTTGSPVYGEDDNIPIAVNEIAVIANPLTDIEVNVI